MARPATSTSRLLAGSREPCRVATTANIDPAAGGLLVVDGVTVEPGDRVLVKNQNDQKLNGIYGASAGEWYRASDARSPRAIDKGVTVHVQEGTANGGKVYAFQTLDPVLGTDDIQISFYISDDIVAGAEDEMEAAADDIVADAIEMFEETIGNTLDAAIAAVEAEGAEQVAAVEAAGAAITGIVSTIIIAENTFGTKGSVELWDPETAPDYVRTAGHSVAGDGGGALYRKVGSEPSHAGKIQSADGTWWEYAPDGAVNVRAFGAWGNSNGTAGSGVNDTAAVHAAFDYAKARGKGVFFPAGCYRVTSGYTNATLRGNLTIFGEARTTTDDASVLGSIIMLDNASAASFFYSGTAGHHFAAHDLRFRCAQQVTDRKFWKISVASVNHRFTDVAFDRVEKPIVYEAGAYFQMSAFTNVQFNDSGTIHSEVVGIAGNTATLVGTLLVLNNVSHDHAMIANTEKVVMNLQSIRFVQATNLLLEGSLPSTGWTVLKLANGYNFAWVRAPMARLHGFFSEWQTNPPAYTVDQDGHRVTITDCDLRLSGTMKYKLSGAGQVHIAETAFSTTDEIASLFDIEDFKCNVVISRSSLRRVDSYTDKRFTFHDCSHAMDGAAATENVQSIVGSTMQSALLHKWDGGLFDGDLAALTFAGGAAGAPSTDATYGRKYVIVPNVNAIVAWYVVKPRGTIVQNTQVCLTITFKLPVFTAGSMSLNLYENGVNISGGAGYDTTYSGQIVTLTRMWRVRAASPTEIGLNINSGTATGVVGNMEIYALALYSGNALPRFEYPSYPATIITRGTAAPTTGTWARGDVVWNTAPAAAGVPGWVCTAAGTPGTWKAMAVLAA